MPSVGREGGYNWLTLQTGSLSLRPDGRRTRVPHACTSALVWPAGESPTPGNSVMTDPCFTQAGIDKARQVLADRGENFDGVGHYFETHAHGDHMLHVPGEERVWRFLPLPLGVGPFTDIAVAACPGHSEDMRALHFRSAHDRVWIVGDAILDEEWLRGWGYYWPNGYLGAEIVQTWRSVARILAEADVVVPGHGAPFRVTPALLIELAAGFARAECAEECSDVAQTLLARQTWPHPQPGETNP